jgi:branched-chain amino acid transport system ATP-binding protein
LNPQQKPEEILEVQGITLAFGGLNALSGVGFSVREGTIYGIIGPNGAGKTSLLNCIGGFYRPQKGVVRFLTEDVTRFSPDRRASMGLARTFQNIALFKGMTVLDNIKLGAHAHLRTNVFSALLYSPGARREEALLREEVENDVIDFLEIEHLRYKTVGGLSYGLQKRVELARALAMRPKVMLLDEPIAGMNQEETEDMARFILDIKEERGVTLVLIEHHMGVVMDICDRIAALNFGVKITEGTPAQVKENPDVVKAYLGKSH